MLSSVVLPAPLGPITDMRAPWVTSRLTRLTACTPPKDLDTSRISSNALTRATSYPRRGLRRPPPKPPPGSVAAAEPPLEVIYEGPSSWPAIVAERSPNVHVPMPARYDSHRLRRR